MKIAVLKEKHAPRYYSFESKEEFEELALGVLKERYEEGWYGTLEYLRTSLAATIERITSHYPEFDLYPKPLTDRQKDQQRELNSKIEGVKEDAATDIDFLETLEKLLALPAGETLQTDRWDEFKSASDLLRHRGDYEYESFEVITPKKFGESKN
jgi:hypothetical protein